VPELSRRLDDEKYLLRQAGIVRSIAEITEEALQRKRYAQRCTEEERYGGESRRKPSLIGRLWEEIRDFIFLPGRRY
jgi:hypothetical protein